MNDHTLSTLASIRLSRVPGSGTSGPQGPEVILDDWFMDRVARVDLLARLAEAVASVPVAHPTRVAIDGPPATGKTTLADELALVLRARDREVIRASIDDFLVPRAVRYRRGEYSASGCYLDAHDHHLLNQVLLDPLGPGGDRRFQSAAYDPSADATLPRSFESAPPNAVLLFDGVFLLRPELNERWDLRVLVSSTAELTVDRAVVRDRGSRSHAEIERRWRDRYLPAQQLYVDTVHPAEHADVIVHNDDPQRPRCEIRMRPFSGMPEDRSSTPECASGAQRRLPR